jgi:hypothetical protein
MISSDKGYLDAEDGTDAFIEKRRPVWRDA